jgi:hypothetical protein
MCDQVHPPTLSTYNESVEEARLRKEREKERNKQNILSIFGMIGN